MSLAHWMYLIGALVIIVAMVFRKNVVVPSIVFTILVAWTFKGSVIFGIESVFNADLYAAGQLFNVFLLITIMVAMLKAASAMGADKIMIQPIQKLMVSPAIAYLILVVATFVISIFFWPTPALPLVGALLIPAAVRIGLSPMTSAMAVAMAGQGMALGGDLVIKAAPKITASAAGIPTDMVLGKAAILSAVTGVVALGIGYLMQRREDIAFASSSLEERTQAAGILSIQEMAATSEAVETGPVRSSKVAVVMAMLIPAVLLAVVAVMIFGHVSSGDATALLGGAGALLLCVIGMSHKSESRFGGLEAVSDFLVEGFVFAFRAMGPVIPIAGFFFLGGSDGAQAVLGPHAPGFLFDMAVKISHALPPGSALAAFGVLILGMLTGVDGSGFAGLPLVGSTAGALANGHPAFIGTLGAVGQVGSIWTGGGTIIAWSSLVAVAGIAGVNVQDLVKKNFLPVIIGLVVSTLLGILLW
ncbi:hypothetical protein JI721_04775 [Alicyclobacillus cycloheptanicus]|uniref:Transporter n=1 Tax=Alicyclobacillus cycloheptanicus TaxID=1457 RepID=A0ABT9XM86_9BACL|nr:hypothetical protein [Alicyclobacillus cycloheptanicus]MDQ0191425.1 hypothetical protein [Alicyclobacillus cycloheptanicus]WDM02138.1 hypothetical protein JI721_04775 [Alicyclobacillus cycloheptanicus]